MRLFYRLCWILVRLYLKLFCRLRIEGASNIPERGGVIIASNHVGAGDPPFIGVSVNRELHYLAKRELFGNLLLRFLIRNLNAIPINRSIFDHQAMLLSEAALRDGYGLILFPEGTRSKSGEFRKGKPGVGLLARRTLVPIVPTYIENSRGFAKLVFTRKRLLVRFGEPITRQWIESVADDNDGYRLITEEVMAKIKRLKCGDRFEKHDNAHT